MAMSANSILTFPVFAPILYTPTPHPIAFVTSNPQSFLLLNDVFMQEPVGKILMCWYQDRFDVVIQDPTTQLLS
jgi:hypothetical protein